MVRKVPQDIQVEVEFPEVPFSKVELPPSSLQSTHIAELEVQRLEAVTTED